MGVSAVWCGGSGSSVVVCLVWDVSVLFCVVKVGHVVELCADECSSSPVMIVVVPSCVFGFEVSCHYCMRDVAKWVEVGYAVSWYCR